MHDEIPEEILSRPDILELLSDAMLLANKMDEAARATMEGCGQLTDLLWSMESMFHNKMPSEERCIEIAEGVFDVIFGAFEQAFVDEAPGMDFYKAKEFVEEADMKTVFMKAVHNRYLSWTGQANAENN